MRAPCDRGTPVDRDRTQGWVNRFEGYREQVDAGRIGIWLEQFATDHRDLAARVLDAVEFVGIGRTEDVLRQVIKGLPGWHRRPNQRTGNWRFVAFGPAGKSGDRMLHSFKVALGFADGEARELIIHQSDLLRVGLGPGDSVVFIDDFSGTGRQALDVWRQSLEELLPEGVTAYLVLVAATAQALERIAEGTRLQPQPGLVLTGEDNFFAEECVHFSPAERDIILQYCAKADRKQPHGYGDCGLVIVFAHRCPNNSLPILHARKRRGKFGGLFPRD